MVYIIINNNYSIKSRKKKVNFCQADLNGRLHENPAKSRVRKHQYR